MYEIFQPSGNGMPVHGVPKHTRRSSPHSNIPKLSIIFPAHNEEAAATLILDKIVEVELYGSISKKIITGGDRPIADTKLIANNIFKIMNLQKTEGGWLPDLLADGGGSVQTPNGIEIYGLPQGAYYIYWEYPGVTETALPVYVGACEEYNTAKDLMDSLSCHSLEALDKLSGEDLFHMYSIGGISVNAYLPDEDKPCNLIFRKELRGTHILDQEKKVEFVTDTALDTVEQIILFTRRYATGLVSINQP